MESIYHTLWRSQEPDALKRFRKLENIIVKSARWDNHRVFNVRCVHSNVTPTSLKLTTTVKGRKAQDIIRNAEKSLLRERINQCVFTIHQLNSERENLERFVYDNLEPEVAAKARQTLAGIYQKVSEKCKTRQRCKYEKLVSKQGTEDERVAEERRKTQERWVINRSNRSLNEAETKVLSRGLKFSVTPSHIPTKEIITSTEEACDSIKDYKVAYSLRGEVVRLVKAANPPKPNISKAEKLALKELKSDESILVLPADKGCATVILNKDEYNTKMRELISDSNTYAPLKKDPTNSYRSKLKKILQDMEKDIPSELYHRLYPSGGQPPRIYGLPKIHKPAVPLRPIVSSIGSVSYRVAKYLAGVISPLIGKNKHFVKDSADFVSKIKGLEVPPGHKLMSYDVTALFTSIPTQDAVNVIEEYLVRDTTLAQRTPMNVEQLLKLLSFCLDTTYFVYGGETFQQTHGTAMGSPVSPLVANAYMERFEERALASAPHPPLLWLRYVDDTFVHIREDEVDSFTNHINQIDRNIKFTCEPEEGGTLAFLDVKIHVLDDGSIKTTVFRKATHTDQYLNGLSHHPLEHKRSVVRSLLNRADNIISTVDDVKTEKDHVRKVLGFNNYDQWIMDIPRKKPPRERNTTPQSSEFHVPIAIPYVRGLSEQLQRVFKKHGVPIYHKPWNTLRQSLVHPKDKLDKFQKCGTIYHIECGDCDKDYVGESKRSLETRFKEHLRDTSPRTAVGDHKRQLKHSIGPDNIKVLDLETSKVRRKVKEALFIQEIQPSLNRDSGQHLPHIYAQLVSRGDSSPSHVTLATTSQS